MKDDKLEIQAAVVRILEKIKNPKLIDSLISHIDDNNVYLQKMVQNVLNAIAKDIFAHGDTDRATMIFKLLYEKKMDEEFLNNLLYCYILQGQYKDALALQTSMKSLGTSDTSLFIRHNIAVLEFLSGNTDKAMEQLQQTFRLVRESDHPSAFCMLLLDGHGHATSEIKLPFEAACLLNLYRTGAVTFEHVSQELYKRFPDEHAYYISKINNGSLV